ncbi:MAG: DUF819 family protein [Paludibacteraceae bacterium]|nr:DUF819 family protein [Paludibacteraceae bacterium]
MIRAILILVLYILMPVLIIEGFKRWMYVKKIGTVVLAYAVGIILALSGACSFEAGTTAAITFSKLQSTLMSVAVPLAIPLMLFNCDFKLWTKALPKTVWSLVGGILAILIAVVSGYFVFRGSHIPDFEKVSAMMIGIYTGGTMNFNALGASLGVDKSIMAIVLAFEMVLTTPYIFFIIGGGYKIFRRLLPYEDVTRKGRRDNVEVQTGDVENYQGMFERKNFFGMLAGLGLSVLFLAIGAGLALLLTGTMNELVVILTITTLAIIASFFKKVRELPKTFELGMFFILIFSVIVASLFDVHSINGGAAMIGAFVLWIILAGGVLHLIFCRCAKVSGDLFTVSQIALLCSPPFVPPVVGAMQNKKVLISGIVIGLVGYAIGTYLGVGLAYLLALI